MSVFLPRVIQWTWGLPQNLIGASVRLFLVAKRLLSGKGGRLLPGRCGHAVVTGWKLRSAMSLGMFLFLPEEDPFLPTPLWVHEYGHSVQSCILGPLFLPFVGLPSVLWASLYPRLRSSRLKKGKKSVSYYRFFPERWANRLGEKQTGMRSPEQN